MRQNSASWRVPPFTAMSLSSTRRARCTFLLLTAVVFWLVSCFPSAAEQVDPLTGFYLSHIPTGKSFGPFSIEDGSLVRVGRSQTAFALQLKPLGEFSLMHVDSGKHLGPFKFVDGEAVVLGAHEFRLLLSSQEHASREAAADTNEPARASDLEAAASLVARLNGLVGYQLFVDGNLWDDNDDEVASRLRLPLEGRTSFDASFRRYPGPTEHMLGSRIYSIALYSEARTPSFLSVAFVNKGDWYIGKGIRGTTEISANKVRELDRQFESEIEDEAVKVCEALAAVLGKPKRGFFGRGAMKEKVDRWVWNGHTFMLAVVEGSYLHLRIMPEEGAIGRGQTKRIRDKDLTALCANRVENRPNGDCVIQDIPMVGQGPKGYCVPATWERCLRYMGVEVDMYVLASAAGTGRGGGSNHERLAGAAKALAERHNRHIKFLPQAKRINLRGLARFIDKGIPLMWSMRVVEPLNSQLTQRSQLRARMQSAEQWKTSLEPVRVAAESLGAIPGGGHVCMIIGYNAETLEIAFSDSWGPQFSERWMTLQEFDALSQGTICYVGF